MPARLLRWSIGLTTSQCLLGFDCAIWDALYELVLTATYMGFIWSIDTNDTSAQIGLVDLLREEYGITPGGVLGHSAGEIACGYGDGCFTREQCVLVAYHRGRMCPEHNISGGLMAAVGLGVEEAEARLAKHGQPGCVVGCDNSPNSVTLSGATPMPRPQRPSMLYSVAAEKFPQQAGG